MLSPTDTRDPGGESPLGVQARTYALAGWKVFPLAPREKIPLTTHGFQDATTDSATIVEWWRRCPNANIGVATGAVSGIVVVDIDGADAGEIDFTPTPESWRLVL